MFRTVGPNYSIDLDLFLPANWKQTCERHAVTLSAPIYFFSYFLRADFFLISCRIESGSLALAKSNCLHEMRRLVGAFDEDTLIFFIFFAEFRRCSVFIVVFPLLIRRRSVV